MRVFLLAILCIILILLLPNLIFPLLFKVTQNNNFDKDYLRSRLAARNNSVNEKSVTGPISEPEWMSNNIIHPYLGFTDDVVPLEQQEWLKLKYSEPKNHNEITIAIFGGSVAYWMNSNSRDLLIQELQKSASFRGKKINVISTALGGYKQPQQLIALNLLLTLGHQVDVAVNIDGFNEIVLPYSDNFESHITPYFPRLWNFYSRKGLNSGSLRVLLKISNLKEKQILLAQKLPDSLKNYAVILMLWNTIDSTIEKKIITLNNQLARSLNQEVASTQTTGQDNEIKDVPELLRYSATVWQNSSAQMSTLLKQNNTLYLHFLQPNQFVSDSKQFSPDEIKLIQSAVTSATDSAPYKYAYAAKEGYPLLKDHGRKLVEKGINFYDTSTIFRGRTDTIYVDTCCHYNQKGYDILAQFIAAEIVKKYQP